MNRAVRALIELSDCSDGGSAFYFDGNQPSINALTTFNGETACSFTNPLDSSLKWHLCCSLRCWSCGRDNRRIAADQLAARCDAADEWLSVRPLLPTVAARWLGRSGAMFHVIRKLKLVADQHGFDNDRHCIDHSSCVPAVGFAA